MVVKNKELVVVKNKERKKTHCFKLKQLKKTHIAQFQKFWYNQQYER